MAVLKCKMCGADLTAAEGQYITECEYCGTKQTLPTLASENLQALYNRANSLRAECEFDKAAEIYEKIVSADAEQAEAYWGLVLCKYGIEYVEDPRTRRRIPTCHRCSYEAASADGNFKEAMRLAHPTQREIYAAEAAKIDELQREIIARVSDGDRYDVFICYKESDESGRRTHDSVIANDIYHELTDAGYRVFYAAITLEGKLGSAYEPVIFSALNTARVMLVIGTKPEYFNAVWVRNEWSRFMKLMEADRTRLLIPCYRGMDPYDMPREFAHLQAQDMGKIGFINDIVRGIEKVISAEAHGNDVTRGEVYQQNVSVDNLIMRARLAIEDGEFSDAMNFAEGALNSDATCAEAYLIKFLAENHAKDLDELLSENDTEIVGDTDYKRASRFATGELAKRLSDFDQKVRFEECKAKYARAEWLSQNMRGEEDYHEAKRLLEESKDYPKSADLLVALDGIYEEMQMRKAAEEKRRAEEAKRLREQELQAECERKQKIKIFSIVAAIAVIAVIAVIIIASVIDSNATGGVKLELSSDERSYIVTGLDNENATEVTIPTEYKGKTVIQIADSAFYNCASLKSVTIPKSVTRIGNGAFRNCTGLTSVTVANGITDINHNTFSNCKSLTSIIIPIGVQTIGYNAFYNCTSLNSITIPNSVTSIGMYALYKCDNLTNIYFDGSQAEWDALGVNYLPEGVTVHYNYVPEG